MELVTFASSNFLVAPLVTPPWRERRITRKRGISVSASTPTNGEKIEVRVCVNRTCARQGSREILSAFSGLAPPSVAVVSCGCLGRCGGGPNVVVLSREEFVRHCATPARAARLLAQICGSERFDPERNLESLALRKKGEMEMEKGNAAEAVDLLSKAIELKPSGGLHLMYKSRSNARLAIGDIAGALTDAKESCLIAPNFPEAYITKGDAHLAMGDCNLAEEAYATALDLDPSIRRSRSFKARVAKLQEKLAAANTSS